MGFRIRTRLAVGLVSLMGFIGLGIAPAAAQVTISPTTVFIQNNFGSFIVINNSNTNQDIQVGFEFGYPEADSLGNVSLSRTDTTLALTKGIDSQIRAFPRAFTLAPGQRQTVRLTVRPENAQPNGVYWTRARITSTPQAGVITATEGNDAVATQLNFIFNQTIGVFYRKGDVAAGVAISNGRLIANHDEANHLFVYRVEMTRTAPFLGRIQLLVFNSENREVFKDVQITSVYTNGMRNFNIPVDALAPGTYTFRVVYEAERADVPRALNFPMEPTVMNFPVTIR